MKRILALAIALLMLTVLFAACGKKYDTYNYNLTKYINLAEYKNVPAQAIKPLSDEEVEEAIQEQIMASINYYAKENDKGSEPIEIGDIATIDYSGYVEGMTEEPMALTDIEITVGYGEYPEEFENALIGHKAGDTFYTTVTLPDTFEDYPDYAGKVVEFFILIDSVSERIVPEYTDDFVRAYLLHDSKEDFENFLRESFNEQNKASYNEAVASTTWNQILENTTVIDYPEKELKENYDIVVASVNNYVTALSLDFASFVKSNFDMTEEEFYEYAMETAKDQVKEEMIVNLIARNENIEITEENYKEIATKIATDTYGLETLEALEEKFDKKEINLAVLQTLVQQFVVDNASVTYID